MNTQTKKVDKEHEELCKISEASVYFCNGVEYRTFVMDKLYSFFQQSKKKAENEAYNKGFADGSQPLTSNVKSLDEK